MITCKFLSYFFNASKKKKKSILSTDLVLSLDKSRKRIVLSCSVMSDSLRPHELYSPPDSSVREDSPGRILEWVAMPSSRRSSQPRNQTQVSHTAGRFFTI